VAERYQHTYLDTTMVFTDFFVPFPEQLVPRLAGLGEKILYGSDFPNLPYDYADQLAGIEGLLGRAPGLDEDWLARVCWHNAVALFGE
jgi:predicted TIM-barrel fold metal-dependent hydrolase